MLCSLRYWQLHEIKPIINQRNKITHISWFLTTKLHAVIFQKTIIVLVIKMWTWNSTRGVKLKIMRAGCFWNLCNLLSWPNDQTVECHAQYYKSLLTHHKHSSLRVTSHIGQVFSSPITGANERLWQRKKWKDKRRMREKGPESKGLLQKKVWTRCMNQTG